MLFLPQRKFLFSHTYLMGGGKVDKQKVAEMYEENAKAVYKYLFCLTHNADLAEDLTQETFWSMYMGNKSLTVSHTNRCSILLFLSPIFVCPYKK